VINIESKYQEWSILLGQLRDQLQHMAHIDDVFWQVVAITKRSNGPSDTELFSSWMANCYADSMAIGLRRMTDRSSGVISLSLLLDDMARHSAILTRERYCSLHREEMRQNACKWFDEFAGEGEEHIARRKVREKIDGMESAITPVRLYANGVVAHRTPGEDFPTATYQELRHALAAAFSTQRWCSRIVSSEYSVSVVPSIQEPWLRGFSVPWLEDGERVPDYVHLDEIVSELE